MGKKLIQHPDVNSDIWNSGAEVTEKLRHTSSVFFFFFQTSQLKSKDPSLDLWHFFESVFADSLSQSPTYTLTALVSCSPSPWSLTFLYLKNTPDTPCCIIVAFLLIRTSPIQFHVVKLGIHVRIQLAIKSKSYKNCRKKK